MLFFLCYVGKRMPSQCSSIDRFKIHEIVSLQKNTSIIPEFWFRFIATEFTHNINSVARETFLFSVDDVIDFQCGPIWTQSFVWFFFSATGIHFMRYMDSSAPFW